jgi:serine/threonine protein kinase
MQRDGEFMANDDAAALAQRAVQARLLTPEQLARFLNQEGDFGSGDDVLRALERKGLLTPWQSHKLKRGDLEGYYHGTYRLLYKVGSGTYGRVFRAEDPQTGMVVAIKVLRKRWMEDKHSVELFEREARVGMELRHPNIVSILYFGKDPKTEEYYFVMEFVEGGNLRDFLAIRKKLRPAEALRVMEDVALGLAHAFSRGVTHRDMKLSNILISSQGEAKLVDFGLAGRSAGAGDDVMDRSVDYAGLEMATNVPPGDVRSDIYFMGCVLFELLTGKSPLRMSRDRQVRMQRERFERVAPMNRGEVEAPHSVFQLVENMMTLNAARRYQTPQQLLGAIRAARADVESFHGHHESTAAAAPRAEECTVFVVEKNLRLQERLRELLKKMGYRVLLSINPDNALNRFRQKPYQALLLDVETVGDEALMDLESVAKEVERHHLDFALIVVLGEDQGRLAKKVPPFPKLAILQRPLDPKQLRDKLRELAPPPAKKEEAAAQKADGQ